VWLDSLKIAIIERDADKMGELFSDIPQFETLEDMKSAHSLIKEAMVVLYELQDETAKAMKQIKKNMEFLDSTQLPKQGTFDIKS